MWIEVVDDYVNRVHSNHAVHQNKMPEVCHFIDECT